MGYIISGFTGRQLINKSRNSGANAETTSRWSLRGKMPLILMIMVSLWAFPSCVSEVAGKTLPFTAGTSPSSRSRDRSPPVVGPEVPEVHGPTTIGEAPKYAAPPELCGPPAQSAAPQQSHPPTQEQPAGQVVQFQQALSSLRINNYTIAAQYISDYLFLLPLGTTLFVPTNEAFHGERNNDDNNASMPTGPVMAYHAILQQLRYQQIALLPVGTRLATLIANNNSIEITRTAPDDLRVDDVRVVQKDICSSDTLALKISCHGIDGFLNMTKWGRSSPAVVTPQGAPIHPPAPSLAPPPDLPSPKAFSPVVESPA